MPDLVFCPLVPYKYRQNFSSASYDAEEMENSFLDVTFELDEVFDISASHDFNASKVEFQGNLSRVNLCCFS